MTARNLLIGCGILVAAGLFCVVGIFLAPFVHISIGQTTIGAQSTQPPSNTTPGDPTSGNTPVVVATNPSTSSQQSGGGPTNGNGQDFTATSAPITGPAIVEWYGDASCGTFKLPAGEPFTWQRDNGGHYWTYATDADVNAAWSAHVAAFNAKPFNQQHACQVDVRP